MSRMALVGALAILLTAGCLSAPEATTMTATPRPSPSTPSATPTAEPTPEPDAPTCTNYEAGFSGGGQPFRISFVNDRGGTACLDVALDGTSIFQRGYPDEPAGSVHERAIDGRWSGAHVRVKATDSHSGLEAEESFPLRASNYFVVTLGESMRIDRYDSPPQFG